MRHAALLGLAALGLLLAPAASRADDRIRETDDDIRLMLPQLEAVVRKKGYVTGVAAQSLLDKKTGFRDAGYGLEADEMKSPIRLLAGPDLFVAKSPPLA